jgi:hypothetical protein
LAFFGTFFGKKETYLTTTRNLPNHNQKLT